jgi:hypothetical protein
MSVLREFLACRSFFFLPPLQKGVNLQLFSDFLLVSSGFDSCRYGTDFRRFADCMHLQTLPGCASACNTDTTQTQPHHISNTQRTENKTIDVVIQQHSRKLMMMDILMSETC